MPSSRWQNTTWPIEQTTALYTEDYIEYLSKKGHTYVALYDQAVSTCGTVMPFWGREHEECVLLSVYVLPELQGRGLGHAIMEALEADE